MDQHKELRFLQELRWLSNTALRHATLLEESAKRWDSADQDADVAQNGALTKPSSRGRQVFHKALHEMHTSGFDVFERIESFLTVWGRISLILFPQGEDKPPERQARAARLRNALPIPLGAFRQRELRNKWLHFDEILDSLPARCCEPVRFVRSDELPDEGDVADTAVRYLVMDEVSVRYAGVGTFHLSPMFEAVGELQTAVAHAIDTWAERNAAELGSDA